MITKEINYKVLGKTTVIAKVREVRKSTKYPSKLMYICDLFNADGKAIATDRYVYDDLFIEFQTGDLEYFEGEVPTIKWNVPSIKAWLADHQVGEEEMAVDGDPYYYMSETELLELVASITEAESK